MSEAGVVQLSETLHQDLGALPSAEARRFERAQRASPPVVAPHVPSSWCAGGVVEGHFATYDEVVEDLCADEFHRLADDVDEMLFLERLVRDEQRWSTLDGEHDRLVSVAPEGGFIVQDPLTPAVERIATFREVVARLWRAGFRPRGLGDEGAAEDMYM